MLARIVRQTAFLQAKYAVGALVPSLFVLCVPVFLFVGFSFPGIPLVFIEIFRKGDPYPLVTEIAIMAFHHLLLQVKHADAAFDAKLFPIPASGIVGMIILISARRR